MSCPLAGEAGFTPTEQSGGEFTEASQCSDNTAYASQEGEWAFAFQVPGGLLGVSGPRVVWGVSREGARPGRENSTS